MGTTLYPPSQGVCRECRARVPATYVADDGRVYLERVCPTHGVSRALVAETEAWFRENVGAGDAPAAEGGRPHACHLPVFSITNACNLRCPICFTYNRADELYFMSKEEFARHIDFVVEATGGVDLVDITGGEPTLHPGLLDLLESARRKEIGRIALNSNGIALARSPDLVRRLADLGIYVILSLDTLDPETSRRVHGLDITREKRQAIENLARFDVQTTVLMVLIGEVNEGELGTILDMALERDFVRSLTIQTMTYTGQGGGTFGPRLHLPVDAVERRIEEATRGRVRRADFVPLPSSHPLCYGVSYLLMDGEGGLLPFTALLDRPTLARHLAGGYLLRPTDELEEDLKVAMDRLWAEGDHPAALATMKKLLGDLYPTDRSYSVHERQRRAERRVKTIYVHAHMDEDTYEAGRAARCPDQVPVHAERLIGACDYNLFHRQQDERFWVE